MKSPCCCRLKCFEAFTEEERSNLFKKNWALGDRNKQWEYMIKYTKKQPKKRQTTEVTLHNRQFTFLYFLPFEDNQAKNVCQTMFLNTLAVGERIVKTAWEKYDGSTSVDVDKRGRYDHKKTKITEDVTKSINDHVKAFAPVESHKKTIT
ncbi:unnamed protein product [Arctia plantaginis]|uniref:Uncharacterized protein n=1 Tax=Arctia plantaginis TaxID=874455 RepID=A0A8S0ZSI8_ARCPL|nr:unnamed protein product [Arctia plantaginis]